jgi:protein required for attachment to host cells
MLTTWIITADSSRARIFKTESPRGPLQELEVLIHPEARLHTQDLTSDFPGRTFDSAGEGRHAMGQPVDPKEQEAIRFAKHLADHLEAARVDGQFDKLIIAAAPKFLGQLRQHLSGQLTSMVTQEIDKNLTQHATKDIRNHLPERL